MPLLASSLVCCYLLFKLHAKQLDVGQDIANQLAAGDRRLSGVMIESFLEAGRQDAKPGQALTYGMSITDACIGWAQTETSSSAPSASPGSRRPAK